MLNRTRDIFDIFTVNATNDRETEGYTAADYIRRVLSDSLLGPV